MLPFVLEMPEQLKLQITDVISATWAESEKLRKELLLITEKLNKKPSDKILEVRRFFCAENLSMNYEKFVVKYRSILKK